MYLFLLGMMDQAWMRETSYGACMLEEMAAGVQTMETMLLPMETAAL